LGIEQKDEEEKNIFGEEEEKILRRGGGENFVISILTAPPGSEPGISLKCERDICPPV